MKSKFLYPLIFVAGLMAVNFSGFQVNGQTPQKKTATVQTVKYTCPMHPEVVKDMPGKCPKCGMKLVEKKNMIQGKMQQANDSATMKHNRMKMMNDSSTMKKSKMVHDTTTNMHKNMEMK